MARKYKNNYGLDSFQVTVRVSQQLIELYQSLINRVETQDNCHFNKEQVQHFLIQCIVTLFAVGYDLLNQEIFILCLKDCLQGASSYDILGGLFREMAKPGETLVGRYKTTKYFSKKFFLNPVPIELILGEVKILESCSKEDWKLVNPPLLNDFLLNNIEQKSQAIKRFSPSSEDVIQKVVKPTISDFWEYKINSASDINELYNLQKKLKNYRILDPACGSGIFLFFAYQELNRIEKMLLDKITNYSSRIEDYTKVVTPHQLYGLDINPFAVQLTQVILWIGHKIAIDKNNIEGDTLPLHNLSQNIICKDAIFDEWPQADAIIGKPPFLGGSLIRQKLGNEYAKLIFEKFSNVSSQVDLCTYWFRLAHENINDSGRVGFIATNSISQGKSREFSLEYIIKMGGYIYNAITNLPLEDSANVYVSIINWSLEKPNECFLNNNYESIKYIPPSLIYIPDSSESTQDITSAAKIQANCNRSFIGIQPNGQGFFVNEKQAQDWLKKDSQNQKVLKLFSSGADLASLPHGTPRRWIIDFNNMELEEASSYQLPFAHVEKFVKPERLKNPDKLLQDYWWKFKRTGEAMRDAIKNLQYYFSVPYHSKWFVFLRCEKNWLPGNSTVVVASDDSYTLGILTSKVHRVWIKALGSSLKGNLRYTPSTCFETFPFLPNLDSNLKEKIRIATLNLHIYRTEQMEKKYSGITQLYNEFFGDSSSRLYKLHADLDRLVMEAYNLNLNDDDNNDYIILKRLLEINMNLVNQEKN
ncbi:MAG TPA: class I SAM-dependent DNA methyltransferase [Planktothrix sp. UBA8407]|jgi:N-6 DNA Methylase.|nr:class I SAM-dependent DNA methyltransferase [Planktothrix sp. UBA8407]